MKKETRIKKIIELLNSSTNNTAIKFYSDDEILAFANSYDGKLNGDIIAEEFTDFASEELDKACRRCSICGNIMREGYCVNGGCSYYCSDECLSVDMSVEEFENDFDEDGDSYYTNWY